MSKVHTAGKPLTPEWLAWARDNLARGCDRREILQTLLQNGFSQASIAAGLGDYYSTVAASPQSAPAPAAQSQVNYHKLNKLTPNISGRMRLTRLKSKKVRLFTIDHFLTDGECSAVAELVNTHCRRSTVTTDNGDPEFRTSSTSELSALGLPIVDDVDEKIARCIGIRLPWSEGIQAQKYEVGEQFKAHTDYFEPGTEEYEQHAKERGQRTWTFMVYLNSTPAGGGTHFVNVGQTFYPKKGQAVVWNNLLADGQPNPDSLHHGMPVEQGNKLIITKWFRAQGSGRLSW